MLDSNSCNICMYSITDPVCRSCYINETGVLLNDLDVHPIAIEIILSEIKDRFPVESLNKTKCILCKSKNVTLCRYCFSLIIERILKELNFTQKIIKNFQYNPRYGEISPENNILENESMLEDGMEMKYYG